LADARSRRIRAATPSSSDPLLRLLWRGAADAVVPLYQFFFQGEQADDAACLHINGAAWKLLMGFDEMIKHAIAANESWVASIRF
jgi:hypothetical protein